MSFKLFIYYCAILGAWAAFAGWALGHFFGPDDVFKQTMVLGMSLGLAVACALSLVDALWNARGLFGTAAQVVVAVAGGCLGGLVSAGMAQALVDAVPGVLALPFRIFGWTLTGLVVGASIGIYDLLVRFLKGEAAGGAVKKIRNGVLGGAVGGLIGGLMTWVMKLALDPLFDPAKVLMTPSAAGFVALGLSVGLMIGLAQVMLKEAWLRVEAGFRAGRELILSKDETTIGRSESCDIGLFGDPKVEKIHARIRRKGTSYFLEDAGTADGTFLNAESVKEPVALHTGDQIMVGKNVLRFGERQKKVVAAQR